MKIQTPYYLLDEDALKNNLSLIQEVATSSGAEIILAFKAFAMWQSFSLFKDYINGATASSLHEVRLCNDYMGVKSHTYCVSYREEEIEEILQGSCHITFNSLNQWQKYKHLAKDQGVAIGLRINPEQSDVATALYNPASPHSRLGILADELVGQDLDGVSGLHFHVLCESDLKALKDVLDKLELNFSDYLQQISWLNIGGGHLMTWEGYDVNGLIKLLSDFQQKHAVQIIVEPGSAFVWQTGDLHTQVLDIVERKDVKTAIIDASFTCHMPDCLEMPYRPAIKEGYSDHTKGEYQYCLGGLSCLAGDYLAAYSFDESLQIGDSITFKDMMHYTMVKTSTFNGIQHPSIAIRRSDGDIKMIKQFGYEDYKNRLS